MNAKVEPAKEGQNEVEKEMSDFEKHDLLVKWWRQSCKEYSLYFLMKTEAEKRQILLSCCPDMPDEPAGTRELRGETVTASDMLLPEMFVEGLLAGQGKCLILLLTRRLASPDTGLENDLRLMNSLHERGQMPKFSNGKLDSFDTPFVDLRDPLRQIQCLTEDSSPTTILTTQQWLREGRLVHADVWLSCTMRRNMLADFFMGLKHDFERNKSSVQSSTDENSENINEKECETTLEAIE